MKLTDDKWVTNIINLGFRIPFMQKPPLTSGLSFQYRTSQADQQLIDDEIHNLIKKEAIEEVPVHTPGFRSQLFTIPKKTGDRRPVLNLKPLNQFIQHRHFKMETMRQVCQMINPGDYMTSIDLTDAFLHVLIHPSSRKYLQFRWHQKVMQWRTLPFGLSLSPLVFTKCLKPVLKWARRKGIRVSAYLDDLLIVARDPSTAHHHTTMLIQKLQSLGFLIKQAKSSLQPSQRIDHLGFTIDSSTMKLIIPSSKIRDLRREALSYSVLFMELIHRIIE